MRSAAAVLTLWPPDLHSLGTDGETMQARWRTQDRRRASQRHASRLTEPPKMAPNARDDCKFRYIAADHVILCDAADH